MLTYKNNFFALKVVMMFYNFLKWPCWYLWSIQMMKWMLQLRMLQSTKSKDMTVKSGVKCLQAFFKSSMHLFKKQTCTDQIGGSKTVILVNWTAYLCWLNIYHFNGQFMYVVSEGSFNNYYSSFTPINTHLHAQSRHQIHLLKNQQDEAKCA